MDLGRPQPGGRAHGEAVDGFKDAVDERSRLRRAADKARETSGEQSADADLARADRQVVGHEAWLAWVERGF